jgi:broad specificity phosphatase PhoE
MYFIRHSERADLANNEEWKKSIRIKQNIMDPPITENGKIIAKNKIAKIDNEIQEYEYIYTSPMTRCLETSIEFQKYIRNVRNIIVPIRVEYGLSPVSYGTIDMWSFHRNCVMEFTDNNMKIISHDDIIDEHLNLEKIFERYGKDKFDTDYNSIINSKEINNETNIDVSSSNRIKLISGFAKTQNDKTSLVCTHGENIGIFACFINKKYDRITCEHFSGHTNYCSYAKIQYENNKFKIVKIDSDNIKK